MLSTSENDLLCRVGAGTPMGDLFRQYWLPALRSDELPSPDCPPVRLRILGENLIAFRTTSGAVGLIQNACPHRGASMFFGRNEEEGLRCVYHGWKFDVERRLRRHAVGAGRVQLQEQGAYARLPVRRARRRDLGLHGHEDGAAAAARVRGQHVRRSTSVQKALRACNWVQALEGDIDTSHLYFLHLGSVKPEDTVRGQLRLLRRQGPHAALQRHRHAVRHVLRRLPPGRSRHVLLAHRHLPLPLLHDDPYGHAGPRRLRARLGADRRREHDVLGHERSQLA